MANSGLRGTFLSTYSNLKAGYRPSNTYIPRYWLYAMLGAGALFIFNFFY